MVHRVGRGQRTCSTELLFEQIACSGYRGGGPIEPPLSRDCVTTLEPHENKVVRRRVSLWATWRSMVIRIKYAARQTAEANSLTSWGLGVGPCHARTAFTSSKSSCWCIAADASLSVPFHFPLMNTSLTRRTFLTQVSQGMMLATVGLETASELRLTAKSLDERHEVLDFGAQESLVRLMQETSADHLMPELIRRIRSGVGLKELVSAGALANARTFGGEDYVGFHTMMALAPAYYMSQELPAAQSALPVLKVLYRNTARIQEHGGRQGEVLHAVTGGTTPISGDAGVALRDAVRSRDAGKAETTFASIAQGSADDAFNALLMAVHDQTEVHRVVLPYRAWDMLGIVGQQHAHTMLRQSLRYCVKAEPSVQSANPNEPKTLLPRLLEEHHLMSRTAGSRDPGDAWVEAFSETLFKSTGAQAASAAAAALADGIAPDAIAEAVSLAANQMILRDQGRTPRDEVAGKPVGSVHGDSIGIHASDSANAWRNMAKVTRPRNCFASVILGAFQVAVDRTGRGGDLEHWQALPIARHLDEIKSTSAEALLRDAEEAIRGNLQAKAAAVAHRYGQQGHAPRPLFDLLLRYAVSEDGSLHAEKFYRTATEEFGRSRVAYRWRYAVALARVTASEFGRPAAGLAEARSLLQLS